MTSATKPIYVLGTGLSHDGSACLLKDGRIAVAIEKERITRRKHDGGNDNAAINYCLEAEGIEITDVALVVQNANFSMFESGNDWFEGPRLVGVHPHVVTISHHLAHAWSAVGTAPFDEAAVLIVDGCGNAWPHCIDLANGVALIPTPDTELAELHFEKDSFYQFADGAISPLAKDFSLWARDPDYKPMQMPTTRHSIGGVYRAASSYCLGGIDDSAKLMGLAPYGRRGAINRPIFCFAGNRLLVEPNWADGLDRPMRHPEDLKLRFQYYADIARWVQDEVEHALLTLVELRHRLCPVENLVFAGGVALNAVANARIRRQGPFRNMYVQPAAADNGLAIGCAYYGWIKVLDRERVPHDGNSAFGCGYTANEVDAALAANAERLVISDSVDPVAETARLLASGAVVGWFDGPSEFGPRALGHRSILADPRLPWVRDHINANIKFREDFRPFAPSVTEAAAADYFDWEGASPYMLYVAQVREHCLHLLPGVAHVDGTARLQTVSPKTDPRFHALLEAFAGETGLPVLLNTSFNRRGMPIVETPKDAIDFFLECGLDALVIEGRVVRKLAGMA